MMQRKCPHCGQNYVPDGGSPLFIDVASGMLSVGGETVRLTRREVQIISVLERNRGKHVLTRDLITEVFGEYRIGAHSNIQNVISSLRKKLARTKAVIGRGANYCYRLEVMGQQ